MLIGIDASQAAKNHKTGVEHLASQLILNLMKIDKINKYLLFSNSRLPSVYKSSNFQPLFIPLRKLWYKFRLPLALIKHRPKVFLEIGYMLPSFSPPKSICFVHDLASKRFPQFYSPRERLILDQSFRRAHRAKEIIFISQNTKNDFNKFYPGFHGKTNTIFPAYDKQKYKAIKRVKDVLNLNSKYILYLGRLESRKNIINLILGYKIFRKKSKIEPKLVLAGKEGFGFEKIKAEINKLDLAIKQDIIMPGYIAENNLPHLYAGAELFIFPSFYEGFGIPILESMACETPVACSNTSSLPEVAGKAAQFFNPNSPEEIADIIALTLTDKNLRKKMIFEGKKQAAKFSYRKMASEVLSEINNISS